MAVSASSTQVMKFARDVSAKPCPITWSNNVSRAQNGVIISEMSGHGLFAVNFQWSVSGASNFFNCRVFQLPKRVSFISAFNAEIIVYCNR